MHDDQKANEKSFSSALKGCCDASAQSETGELDGDGIKRGALNFFIKDNSSSRSGLLHAQLDGFRIGIRNLALGAVKAVAVM